MKTKRFSALVLSVIVIISAVMCVPVNVYADMSKGLVVDYCFDYDAGSLLAMDMAPLERDNDAYIYGNASIVYDNEKQSNVLYLDGSDNTYLELPQGFFDNRNVFSIVMDIKPMSAGGNFFTFTYGADNTHYSFLRLRGNEVRNAITVDSYWSEHDVKGTGSGLGVWQNVVITVDNTIMSLYIDGLLVSTADTGIKTSDLGTNLLSYIGKSLYDGDAYFNGYFEDFRIYNRVLTSDEVLHSVIDKIPLLRNITVGTLEDNPESLSGTDTHTQIGLDFNRDNGVISSYIKPSVPKNAVEVTFKLSTPEAQIIIDGKPFVNGSKLDMCSDRAVEIRFEDRTEHYTLLKAEYACNPVLPGQYADPDIDYFNGKYWIYPTTDGTAGWGGTQFHAWSSDNLVNWEDEGVILDVQDKNPPLNAKGIQIASSPWSDGNAWAPAIEEKNGKYYFYYCGNIRPEYTSQYGEGKAIGVAVANAPQGPYTASSSPIVYPKMLADAKIGFSGQVIDPAVYTEGNSSYLLFGNGMAVICDLNSDMTSVNTNSFYIYSDLVDFRESVAVFKRGNYYHFTWSCDDTGSENYHVKYATSTSLKGKVTNRGVILQKDKANNILGTAHQSVYYNSVTDKCYIAYHRFYTPLGIFNDGFGFHRETCIEELTFGGSTNNDSKVINPTVPTMKGVAVNLSDISSAQISVTEIPLISTGSEIKPAVTVKYNNNVLVENRDYTLTYSDNIDVGTATVTVNGIGNYYGAREAYFKIICSEHSYIKNTVQPDCTNTGYTVYTCESCGYEYTSDYKQALGHMPVYQNENNSILSYRCSVCGALESKTTEEVALMWNVDYVNKPPVRTGVNNSAYVNFVNDGIINDKDYAVLNKLLNK